MEECHKILSNIFFMGQPLSIKHILGCRSMEYEVKIKSVQYIV